MNDKYRSRRWQETENESNHKNQKTGMTFICKETKTDDCLLACRTSRPSAAVVCNDHPMAVDLSEQQGKAAADIPGRPFQMPFPDYKKVFGREGPHFDEFKLQLPHQAGIAVIFLIIPECILIAIGHPASADEHQGVIIPVPFHEFVDIAPVPGGHLLIEYFADSHFIVILAPGGQWLQGREEQGKEDHAGEGRASHKVCFDGPAARAVAGYKKIRSGSYSPPDRQNLT